MHKFHIEAQGTTAAEILATAVCTHSRREALRVGGVTYTYRELLARIIDYQALAQARGLGPADKALFVGEPGIDSYAFLLAGVFGSYTASLISGSMPMPVLSRIIRDLAPGIVVATDRGLLSAVDGYHIADVSDIGHGSAPEPLVAHAPQAYLSLTSGTTGQPTCALADANGLGQFLLWATDCLELTPHDRWFEGSDPSADLAITNALLTFAVGASLTVPFRRQRLRAATLAAMNDTTVMRLVPSVGSLMLAEALRRRVRMPHLRLLAFGGDDLPVALPFQILSGFQSTARTLNTYGMTEASGFVMYHWFDATQPSLGSPPEGIPLGRPVPGARAWIAPPRNSGDTQTNGPLSTGELVIESTAVALEVRAGGGELLLRKSGPGARGELHTGDIVRHANGSFFYQGRMERTAKIHGIRVNLAHADKLLTESFGMNVCVLEKDGNIVIMVESSREINRSDLIESVGDLLQDILIPKSVITLPRLPRTRTGKVNIAQCEAIAHSRRRLENNRYGINDENSSSGI